MLELEPIWPAIGGIGDSGADSRHQRQVHISRHRESGSICAKIISFWESIPSYKRVNTRQCRCKANKNEVGLGLVEWTRNTKPIGCPRVKKEVTHERYDSDKNNYDKIFDLLLQEKHRSLPLKYVLPLPEELRRRSGASGTTPPCITPVNVGYLSDIFSWSLNMGISSLMIRRGPQRLMGIPFL
jgi:hypothetical protein